MELKEGLFAGIVAGVCISVFLSLNLASPEHTLEAFTLTKSVTSAIIWSVILGVGGILGASVDHILKRDSWNTMAVAMALYTYLFYLASNATVGAPTGMTPNSFPILEMLIAGISAAFGYNHMLHRGTPLERPTRFVKQESLFEFSPIKTEVGLPPKTRECYRLAKTLGGTALLTDSSRKVRVDHQFVTEIIFDEVTLVQSFFNPNFIFGIPGLAIFEFPEDVKRKIKESMKTYHHYYSLRCRSLNRFPFMEFYGGLFSGDKPSLSEKLNDGNLLKALLQARVHYVKLKGDKITIVSASKDRLEMLVKALQLLQKTLDGKGFAIPKVEEPAPAPEPRPEPIPAPAGKIHREEIVKELVRTAKPQITPPPPMPESSVVQRLIKEHAPQSIKRQYEPEPKLKPVIPPKRPAIAADLVPEWKGRVPEPKPAKPTRHLPPKDDPLRRIWGGGAARPKPKKPEEKKPSSGIRAIPLRHQ